MMNKFVLVCDGFVRDYRYYDTVSEAKEVWRETVRNKYLYQYDVAIHEVDENKQFVRRLSYEEVRS